MKIGTDGFKLPPLFFSNVAPKPQAECTALQDLMRDERLKRMLSN